jgi:hypothetical protein
VVTGVKRPGSGGRGELEKAWEASLKVTPNPHAMQCCDYDMVSVRMLCYDVRGK